MIRCFALLFCISPMLSSIALAGDKLIGPISARVLKVHDGDTLQVMAHIWPGHDVRVHVRIKGINAPELKSKCKRERRLALRARSHLQKLVSDRRVQLKQVTHGKYYGRVLAQVSGNNRVDIKTAMLESGHARAYRGRKRNSWCGENQAAQLN